MKAAIKTIEKEKTADFLSDIVNSENKTKELLKNTLLYLRDNIDDFHRIAILNADPGNPEDVTKWQLFNTSSRRFKKINTTSLHIIQSSQ